jgi:signal transduction histidine kinase
MWRFRSRETNVGHGQRLWPVFAVLIAVVVLPTAGVLWFMKEAMQNEQYAVHRRLEAVYQSQLKSIAGHIQLLWQEKAHALLDANKQNPKSEVFAALAKQGLVDSVLLYRDSLLVYPVTSNSSNMAAEPQTKLWREAHELEFGENASGLAAKAYGEIARKSADIRESATALTAEARCLNKAGKTQEAINLLTGALNIVRYQYISDANGRMIAPNALLYALQLIKDPSLPIFQKTAALLAARLNNYSDPAMLSSQRRFLMEQLKSLWAACPQFPTFAAEELAAASASEFAEATWDRLKTGQMQPTKIRGIWAFVAPDKSLIALFRQERLLALMNSAISRHEPISGVETSPLLPGAANPSFLKIRIGNEFPSWQLGLSLNGLDPFESASKQKIATYAWIGILLAIGVLMLSVLLFSYLQRQVRLTRLKNDLIATVSHELKTPLASMRLLVDTLRDGHYQDQQLVQEYLQMISKENARLSSLIEGFLAFSRMERNKAKFEQEIVQTEEVVHAALEAVGNRLQAPGCQLEVDLAKEMPAVIGDRDALITVMVNLLDNALKYTGDKKEILLRGYASNGNVWIEVQDNGVGFPRSASKKIFDRFYQVDRTLSRHTGGCGLGLSIVQFIIKAHNGSIVAQSQPGQGSTFTIQLPAA